MMTIVFISICQIGIREEQYSQNGGKDSTLRIEVIGIHMSNLNALVKYSDDCHANEDYPKSINANYHDHNHHYHYCSQSNNKSTTLSGYHHGHNTLLNEWQLLLPIWQLNSTMAWFDKEYVKGKA